MWSRGNANIICSRSSFSWSSFNYLLNTSSVVPYFECFVSCLGSFSCECYVRLMTVVKDPRKITERKVAFGSRCQRHQPLFIWPTAFTPKEKGNMPASKTMCLRKGYLLHGARRRKETEMGTPTSFLRWGPVSHHLPMVLPYNSALCPPRSQPGTDGWGSEVQRSELTRARQRVLVVTSAPGEWQRREDCSHRREEESSHNTSCGKAAEHKSDSP